MNRRTPVLFAAALAAWIVTAPVAADSGNDPVGTWLLTVEFPVQAGLPPFKEFVSLHRGGTVTETNGSLNSNVTPGSPLLLTASDGFGSWRRAGNAEISVTFLKMVFCGEGFGGPEVMLGCMFANQHLGYLRVRLRAHITGDVLEAGLSQTDLLIGTDPELALPISFGEAAASGVRVLVQAP